MGASPIDKLFIHDLPTPALLLDVDVLETNLERMAERAQRLGVSLRPHVKSHKCVEVAELQRSLGAGGLTVSTLYEAQVFADHGFDDLTWAFPVNLSRLDEARLLAQRVDLGLLVDSEAAVNALEALASPFRVWLKVDCGYHRAGVDPGSAQAWELARRLCGSESLDFAGLLTHSGHAYDRRGLRELEAVAEEERSVTVGFAESLRQRDLEVPAVSVGSTPAMSAARNLDGVTEARPGNYVFYDFMQCVIGSCSVGDCALTVLASVVSQQPGAGHAVVDAGALALSKDSGPQDSGLEPTMGEIFQDYGANRLHPDLRLTGLSQEHGKVSGRLAVGAKVRILPNHSCLAAAQFDEYFVVEGDRVRGRWKVWRGR